MLCLTAIEPAVRASTALPCQLPHRAGQGVLERLADKPSLPIGDRVEGHDGQRRRAGVELELNPRTASTTGSIGRLSASTATLSGGEGSRPSRGRLDAFSKHPHLIAKEGAPILTLGEHGWERRAIFARLPCTLLRFFAYCFPPARFPLGERSPSREGGNGRTPSLPWRPLYARYPARSCRSFEQSLSARSRLSN